MRTILFASLTFLSLGGPAWAGTISNEPDLCETDSQCDDGNPCTDDFCNASKVCEHEANSAMCDDDNACTRDDRCMGGICIGSTSTECPASDECHHKGVCDPTTGACSDPQLPDGVACAGGACEAGICTSSQGTGGDDSSGSTGSGTTATTGSGGPRPTITPGTGVGGMGGRPGSATTGGMTGAGGSNGDGGSPSATPSGGNDDDGDHVDGGGAGPLSQEAACSFGAPGATSDAAFGLTIALGLAAWSRKRRGARRLGA